LLFPSIVLWISFAELALRPLDCFVPRNDGKRVAQSSNLQIFKSSNVIASPHEKIFRQEEMTGVAAFVCPAVRTGEGSASKEGVLRA
jgi:hypothetical protein